VKLVELVSRPDTPRGRVFDWLIQGLILVSVLSIGLETLPGQPAWASRAYAIEEFVVVIVFSCEYVLRIAAAKKKLAYVFSFSGLVDLFAIAPFYFSGADLRALRAFRLLRLLRILKLARYSAATERLAQAFYDARAELAVFLGVTLLTIYLCAIAIFHFEHEAQPDKFVSVLDGLWWAVTTLTTVNFGDVYPITPAGKLFTAFILICGLGIIAVPTGLVTSALSKLHAPVADSDQRAAGRPELGVGEDRVTDSNAAMARVEPSRGPVDSATH
jgi:voltage-gated potassium channel